MITTFTFCGMKKFKSHEINDQFSNVLIIHIENIPKSALSCFSFLATCWWYKSKKIVNRALNKKRVTLKELENGHPKQDVPAKYSLPNNTWSIRMKNKDKVFSNSV